MSNIGAWDNANSAPYYGTVTTAGAAYGAATAFTDLAGHTIYCSNVTITNDGPGTINYSWDGVLDHGLLYAGESRTIEIAARSSIYLRHAAVACTVRVWAS